MKCEQVARDEMLEKYICDRLSESERDALEQHYLECAHCFEQLKAYRALHSALRRSESAIRREAVVPPSIWSHRAAWVTAAAVAVFAVVVGLGLWRSTTPGITPSPVTTTPAPAAPPPALSELAAFQPPTYTPLDLRGPADEATLRFRSAMQHYVKGDFRAAVPALRSALALEPKAPSTQFFLAVCYLLTDENQAAIEGLKKTIALGKTPFLEEAHFYLGKAYLRAGNVEAAREQLKETAQLQGELQAEAERLLMELAKLPKSPR